MVGSVNGIVDSFFAAENASNRQNTVNTKTGNSFSDYLNYALLNSQSGALFGNGQSSNYSYLNPMSGSIWQTFALKALADGIQQNTNTTGTKEAQQEKNSAAAAAEEKKTDWARIRVIHRYSSPIGTESLTSRGVLV